MDTVKEVIVRDSNECTMSNRIEMKRTEIRSYKQIISRRNKIIKNYLKIGRTPSFLIQSTNALQRELMVAEAELRQLQAGIVMN